MAEEAKVDQLKEKFRPDESALDQEVDAALVGVAVDQLYGFDKPQPAAPAAADGTPAAPEAPREMGG
jgi:hypothetical protein